MNKSQPAVDGSEIPPAAPPDVTTSGARTEAEAAAHDVDLRASLDSLSQLATGRMDLTDVLTRAAEFAVSAISGADWAGLTLLEAGRHDTVVASARFVAEVHAIQYGMGEGPCVTAAAEPRTVRSGAPEADPQWPRFGPRVGRLGVHSALSATDHRPRCPRGDERLLPQT